jgi:hypothetical protein
MDLSEMNQDRRDHSRKKVALHGGYIKIGSEIMGDMLVEDLSFTGLSFMAMSSHGLKVGDTILLKFRLDDQNLTEIIRDGVVRNVQDSRVGVEFLRSASLDRDLGFYLLA